MKPSQKPKRATKRQRELAALQVQEYVDRYHPDSGKVVINVSPCGRFASVRNSPQTRPNTKKTKS